jgi:hypothetical protein
VNRIHEIHKQIVRQRAHRLSVFQRQQNSLCLTLANENGQVPITSRLLQNEYGSHILMQAVNNPENNKFTAICHIFLLMKNDGDKNTTFQRTKSC